MLISDVQMPRMNKSTIFIAHIEKLGCLRGALIKLDSLEVRFES